MDDPFLWLEDLHSDRALDWVRARSAEAEAALGGPELTELETAVREVLDSPDRIPHVRARGEYLYNFWTDAEHPRGLWRRCTWEGYRRPEPDWQTLIDVDRLNREEEADWVWHGAAVLRPDRTRALVDLSPAGSDADETREFDLTTLTWVPGGFHRPLAKGSLGWIDAETVWVATDTGPGSLTRSGYPRTARRWRRGTPLEDSEVVLEGREEDLAVQAWHDHTPGHERDFVRRDLTFFTSRTYLLVGGDLEVLDVPDSAEVGVVRDWLTVHLREDWSLPGALHPAGSLLVIGFEAFRAGHRDFTALYTPTADSACAGACWTRSRLVTQALRHVRPTATVWSPPTAPRAQDAPDRVASEVSVDVPPSEVPVDAPGLDVSVDAPPSDAPEASPSGASDPDRGWTSRPVAGLDPLTTVGLAPVDTVDSDLLWRTTTGFLRPTTLSLLDPASGADRPLRQAPTMSDAQGMSVEQHFATSDDGTAVPYFLVRPPGSTGPVPTLLYGYGGFEIDLTPSYSGSLGRCWLARGGAWAQANIRGGGEYGPRWHEAARGSGRHLAYEDFAAVARDLVARGVTTPERLGCQGGSNGGLLVGNMLTTWPDLFGAIVCQVPLLDMRRYADLLAGASWVAEYGDPHDPEQWEHLRTISPYHLFDPARRHPPTLLMTSTADDRVHPGHARKMAALMAEAGADVTYWENTQGGHGGAADNAQAAHMAALAYRFLWKHLGPDD